MAIENEVKSIAFPSISTGVYGYPTEKAATVALEAIQGLAESNSAMPELVQFVLFDDATYNCYSEALTAL